jgi:hypothetical protein
MITFKLTGLSKMMMNKVIKFLTPDESNLASIAHLRILRILLGEIGYGNRTLSQL